MMGKYLRITAISLIVVGVAALPAKAQETRLCQHAEAYVPPVPGNTIEVAPLKVQRVFGRAILEGRDTVITGYKINPACLSLFTEDSHQFVAIVPLDDRGRFKFSTIAPGNYRLIAQSPGLCTGNTKIKVTDSRVGRGKEGILVHFRIRNIDDCTFADYDDKGRHGK